MPTPITEVFAQHFEGSPLLLFAPGRINLIGEHTDYHDGFVLPASISLGIQFAVRLNGTSQIRLWAEDLKEGMETDLPITAPSEVSWANFFTGVVAQFQERGIEIPGFDCAFSANLPIGAGLSSSAALESGIGMALTHLLKLDIDRPTLALIGQKAEHTYVGVMCGIMDQFASLMGKDGHVFRLDCRTLEYEYCTFPAEKYDILLVNSMVKHALSDSGYNDRRKDAEQGLSTLQDLYPNVKALRDVSLEQVLDPDLEISPLVRKRCRYVVEENARVLSFVQALKAGNYDALGPLLYASHHGLQHDYEVSCEELDFLVELSQKTEGVIGSRMMGGGFGGCTINLVEKGKSASFIANWQQAYEAQYGIAPEYYLMQIGEGVSIMDA